MKMKNRPSVNEGIQANVVKADVLAVGRGARAVNTVLAESDRQEILTAVRSLQQELGKLNLDKPHLEAVMQHAEELKRNVAQKQPSPEQVQGSLGTLITKLKQVGVVVKEVSGLVSPIQTIAGLLHLSLSSLGLM
jgi:ABC-type transporter Mla subunit MlaD